MISDQGELATKKKLAEKLNCPDDCETFSMKTTVILLCIIATATCKSHRVLITVGVDLTENNTEALLTPVSSQEKK